MFELTWNARPGKPGMSAMRWSCPPASSVSYRDMSLEVIQGLGGPGVLVHGVSVKPGKPTILAMADGVPVFGLPGNPASAMVVAELFVVPAIRALLGASAQPARLCWPDCWPCNVASTTGREDFVPVRLETRPDGLWAVPVFGDRAGVTLLRADGTCAWRRTRTACRPARG